MYIIVNTIDMFLNFLYIALVVDVVLSWLRLPADNQFVSMVNSITGPILTPIRKALRNSALTSGMGIDFSPLIAMVLISIVRTMLVGILV